VQNRVSIALPRLPDEVQHVGVSVRKKSPDLLLVVHLISPDKTLDQQYISNYATVNIKDVIARVDGVGDTIVFGARDYAMRVWLDPAKLQSRSLTASDAVAALQANNVQVASGAINQPPAKSPGAFQIAVQTLGRLSTPAQFEDIVVATDADGRVTHLRDIARVELGSQDYTVNAYLDNQVATAIGIFQRPGSVLIVRDAGTFPGPGDARGVGGNERFAAVAFKSYPTHAHIHQPHPVRAHLQRVLAAQIHRLRRRCIHDELPRRRPDQRVNAELDGGKPTQAIG